ncbi:tripartite tricarboxylate transporter permease [Pseudochelatococcus sp. B33]
MDVIIDALLTLVSGWHLFYLVFGVYLGLIIGVLPGLGGAVGLAMLLPFVFGMDPGHALAMMIGLQAVTTTSDTFPAVLMGIPGTSASQATVVDGFPMAKKGEAARALGAAFSSSLIGGVFGAIVLSIALFSAMPLLRLIGFGEQMMLVIVALSMVGVLTGDSVFKGLVACGLGLLIGAIGSAPASGFQRFTFETAYLIDGVPLIIVGLGLFAVPEIVDLLRRDRAISDSAPLGGGWLMGIKDTIKHWPIVLRCSGLGALMGALPGVGGSVIDWIAYGNMVQTAKDKSGFGKGDVRGVIAPEAATNAKEGGALIPTLLLGIPGSGAMAIMLAGFVLIGIRPGIDMVTTNLDLTFTIIWSLAIANIIGAGTCIILAKPVAKLTTIPYPVIAPFMIALIFFAAFQPTRDWGDLVTLLVLGTLGVYMKRFGWPRPALMIGFVLAGGLEAGIYRTTQVYGWSFLGRPIVIVLILIAIASIIAAIRYKGVKGEPSEDGAHTTARRLPQIIFFLVIVAFTGYTLIQSMGWQYANGMFPRAVSAIMLLLLIPVGYILFFSKNPHPVLHDLDRTTAIEDAKGHSNEYYIAWLVALLGFTALFGFVIAMMAFVYGFLRLKAGLSHVACAISSVAMIIIFNGMAYILTLEYPEGIFQPNIPSIF